MHRLGLLALSFGATAAVAFMAGRKRRRRDERRTLKQEVQKWEGEGGNVPQVPTVRPAPAPASSVPPELST